MSTAEDLASTLQKPGPMQARTSEKGVVVMPAYNAGRTLRLTYEELPKESVNLVILVDDGVAAGSTMRTAIAALRKHGAKRVVIAVPTAQADLKYYYAQNMALHYLLTGDDRYREAAEAVSARLRSLWSPVYDGTDRFWTERHAGFTLLAHEAALMVTDDQAEAISARAEAAEADEAARAARLEAREVRAGEAPAVVVERGRVAVRRLVAREKLGLEKRSARLGDELVGEGAAAVQPCEVEVLGEDEGAEVSFTPVLVVDGDTVVSKPGDLTGATVSARVIGTAKGVEQGDRFNWRYTIDLPVPSAEAPVLSSRSRFSSPAPSVQSVLIAETLSMPPASAAMLTARSFQDLLALLKEFQQDNAGPILPASSRSVEKTDAQN